MVRAAGGVGGPGGGDAGLKRIGYRYRLLLNVLALEHVGWYVPETRCSKANAANSMTIRVTHIYRRYEVKRYLVHRHAYFPPSDQRGPWGNSTSAELGATATVRLDWSGGSRSSSPPASTDAPYALPYAAFSKAS